MAWIELHQGLREHRKLFACADELKVSRIQMVGILVSIWLWALDNAPDGSLKDISNRTVARICDWPEKKADVLVAALQKTGWLDLNGDDLSIHDWFDYAGKLMERREKDRIRKKNGKGNRKISAGIPTEQTGNSCATVPNRTITVPNLSNGEGTGRIEGRGENGSPPPENDLFFVFWNAYPERARRNIDTARAAWNALNPDEQKAQEILKHLQAWKLSKRWTDDDGEFIPNAQNFLDPGKQYLSHMPATAKQEIPKGASGTLGEAELEAIQRLFEEG